MKKFLMYVIIVVTCLFLGFTIYYLTQNNENIYVTISKDESIYKNQGESISLDNFFVWTKPYKTTTIDIKSGDENVVSYDEETKRFNCNSGGFTTITITPSNDKFGPFIFEIYVGDGTFAHPFVIDSAEDLALIGNDPALKFKSTCSYILIQDVDLRSYNNGVWSPLGEFSGNFDGDGHIIYNLNITSGTNVGLFSSIAHNALVEDVKFSSATISGSFDNAGVVAGINRGTIGKCEVLSAKLTNTSTGNTGAIVGSNLYETTASMVNMCSAKAEITASGNAGGIVGYNQSSIVLNCRSILNSVTATSSSAKIGGIIGYNISTYDDSNEFYYASAIKNSYAIINKKTGNATYGGIVGVNEEESYTGQLFFNNYKGCIYALNAGVSMNAVGSGAGLLSPDAQENLIAKSKSELLDKNSYDGYSFNSVWQMVSSETANINYQAGYETYKIIAIGKEVTNEQQDLSEFLTNLKIDGFASTPITYRVTRNDTVNLGGAYWETIAPNQDEPMIASIIVEDGVTCEIENFKLSGSNSSFFGYISGNTIIKGITFKDFTVESCDTENSGVVATALINGATLENVKVSNYKSIKTNATNVGVICGYNKGSIVNCSVNCGDMRNLTVRLSDSLLSVGGIAGYNDGYISGCYVNGVKLCVDISGNRNGSINFGGLVGTANSGISNSKVVGFVCETTATGVVYAGGVVGYATSSNFDIYRCSSTADISIITSNTNAYLGGLVGYLSGSVSVKSSYYDSGDMACSNLGGLVGINYGTIFSCYCGGSVDLTGLKVGGMVSLTYGRVTDCYTLCHLVGIGSKSRLAGFTYWVGPDCYIEHCFSNATFAGEGKYYAESWSEFRTWEPIQWMSNISNPTYWGDVINNIVLVNNGAKIQPTVPIFDVKKGWIDATYEECHGDEGNYAVFKDTAGFDTTIWYFGNGFPKLIDIAD